MKRNLYMDFLAHINESNKGVNGVKAEVLVRDALNVHGISSKDDMRARLLNQTDCSIKLDGHYVRFEVKTGAGALLYGNFTKDDLDAITDADIFPDIDFVVFGIDGKLINEETFRKTMVVFTREDFIEMLHYTGKHGLRSSIKIGKNGAQVQIQEWKTKACEARYNKFWDYVEENDIPDLDTFLRQIGRG